jgi:hypothetical protein
MEKKNGNEPTRNSGRNVPPPVYRPVAAALQPKNASPGVSVRSAAPPVYRPFAAVSQLKPAGAPPVYRPAASALQPKNAAFALPIRSGAPPVYHPRHTAPPVPVVQPRGLPAVAQRRLSVAPAPIQMPKTRTVIQLAPSILTMDANLAGLKNGTRGYPDVNDASPSDKAPGFTYKSKTYHFTFIPDMYHLTDESDGKHHYFFRFGADGLEDINRFPHSTSRKGHDHPLSSLPDKGLLELVQKLFNEDLSHPTALALDQGKEEEIKKIAREYVQLGICATFSEALALARE